MRLKLSNVARRQWPAIVGLFLMWQLLEYPAHSQDVMKACVGKKGAAAISECGRLLDRCFNADGETKIASCAKLIETSPNDADLFMFRGRGHLAKRSLDRSKADFTKAIQLDPRNVAAYVGRCAVHEELEAHELAIADCSAAIRLEPNRTVAYVNRANAYLMLGKPESAISDIDKAVSLAPTEPTHFYVRGNAFLSMVEGAKMTLLLNHAKHENASARTAASETFKVSVAGYLYKAIGDYTKAIQLRADPQFFYARAKARLALGVHSNDMETLILSVIDTNTAILKRPGDANTHLHRARLFDRLGRIDLAIVDWETVARIDPKRSEATSSIATYRSEKKAADAQTIAIDLEGRNREVRMSEFYRQTVSNQPLQRLLLANIKLIKEGVAADLKNPDGTSILSLDVATKRVTFNIQRTTTLNILTSHLGYVSRRALRFMPEQQELQQLDQKQLKEAEQLAKDKALDFLDGKIGSAVYTRKSGEAGLYGILMRGKATPRPSGWVEETTP